MGRIQDFFFLSFFLSLLLSLLTFLLIRSHWSFTFSLIFHFKIPSSSENSNSVRHTLSPKHKLSLLSADT